MNVDQTAILALPAKERPINADAIAYVIPKQPGNHKEKFILFSLASWADENGISAPDKNQMLGSVTNVSEKTLTRIPERLIAGNFIADTGERRGDAEQIIIYQIIGFPPDSSSEELVP